MTTLETDRLILRPLRDDDAEGFIALIDNWNVAKTVARIPHPYTRADFDAFLERQVAKPSQTREPTFAVEVKGGPAHAVGLIGIHREQADDKSVARLGYWIGEPFWGKGLVSEGARVVIAHAFDDLGFDTILAGFAIANPASGRILEKLGFVITGEGSAWLLANKAELPSKFVRLLRAERIKQPGPG